MRNFFKNCDKGIDLSVELDNVYCNCYIFRRKVDYIYRDSSL